MSKKHSRRRLRCRSITVRSLAQFVDAVHDLEDDWSDQEDAVTGSKDGGDAHVWFRGHADKTWDLKPKLFRTGNEIRPIDEAELYGEFVRRGGTIAPTLAPDLHAYFVMQHHGVPTRLLDWTASAFTALYFALRHTTTDAAVWAINPLWLNSQTVGRYGLVDPTIDPVAAAFRVDILWASMDAPSPNPLLSIAIRPSWVSPRMFAQRSMFTLHGATDIPIEQYRFINSESPLCRIVIPHRHREHVLVGLRACGITETAVYPDLDGLARELITEYGGF